ncbi:unnamed protein product [Spirodela intermedia]|uniref:J domain-containing protein n=1 Tax=Spirodela intermedia TaxID=51605 RepID=A0A7I8JPR9_SPIIN|nr:unnamed protein product [Spirodela intermedia]CAA6671795.1 unnamed protein product [Spirodela intermedia]
MEMVADSEAGRHGCPADRKLQQARIYPGSLWPSICHCCLRLWGLLLTLLRLWSDCVARGIWSLIALGITTLFVILWSLFLCLTSTFCLVYALLILGAACATIRHLGYTPGLFLVGLLGILTNWIYGNLWVIAALLIIAGILQLQCPLPDHRFNCVLCLLCVCSCWMGGILLLTNLSFLSNDLLTTFLQGYDEAHEAGQREEPRKSEPIAEDFVGYGDFSSPGSKSGEDDTPKSHKESDAGDVKNSKKDSSLSEVVKPDSSSLDEMKRIMDSSNHYEALGLPRNKSIDVALLKREYKKKAVLVHPDKNNGNPLASDSFKRLQSAYEVLSDITRKRAYDEKLRKEELSIVPHKHHASSNQDGMGNRYEKSRHISCILCGKIHIWTFTNRSTSKARWCQDCCQYHQAKDGEGWIEMGPTRFTSGRDSTSVCLCRGKVFDVTEWATCQTTKAQRLPHPSPARATTAAAPPMTTRTVVMMAAPAAENKSELWLKQAFASGRLSESHHTRRPGAPSRSPRGMGS